MGTAVTIHGRGCTCEVSYQRGWYDEHGSGAADYEIRRVEHCIAARIHPALWNEKRGLYRNEYAPRV